MDCAVAFLDEYPLPDTFEIKAFLFEHFFTLTRVCFLFLR